MRTLAQASPPTAFSACLKIISESVVAVGTLRETFGVCGCARTRQAHSTNAPKAARIRIFESAALGIWGKTFRVARVATSVVRILHITANSSRHAHTGRNQLLTPARRRPSYKGSKSARSADGCNHFLMSEIVLTFGRVAVKSSSAILVLSP
jgi:hypothetical protein